MNQWVGLICVVAAGMLNGSYALPLKKTRNWSFENVWLVYSVVGMLVVSWSVALFTVPHLLQVFSRAGAAPLLMAFSFGLIWGLANLLFGAGISLIGMSLSFPICMGVSTALGTFIPMARDPEVFLTRGGATITFGIVVLLAGVILCAVAGVLMDARSRSAMAGTPAAGGGGRTLRKGLPIVVLAGICDPFLNFALAFGEPVKNEAAAAGASRAAAADAIWVIVLMGSLLVNVAYCTNLLHRNGTWSRFSAPGTAGYWLLASVMGIVWMLSITLYGRGASMMGTHGDSVGWAVFYCSIIIFSTFWGIVCGEWREGRGRPLRTLCLGLAVLMVAIVILSYGNSLAAKPATSVTIIPEKFR